MKYLTVRDLINALENEDPAAPIYIMHQQSYPFELAIGGITTGADLQTDEEYAGDGPESSFHGDELPPRGQCVYLVETGQTRYGDRDAWEAMRRIRRTGDRG